MLTNTDKITADHFVELAVSISNYVIYGAKIQFATGTNNFIQHNLYAYQIKFC